MSFSRLLMVREVFVFMANIHGIVAVKASGHSFPGFSLLQGKDNLSLQ
nr:hypothetical protein [Erwinia typographi]